MRLCKGIPKRLAMSKVELEPPYVGRYEKVVVSGKAMLLQIFSMDGGLVFARGR